MKLLHEALEPLKEFYKNNDWPESAPHDKRGSNSGGLAYREGENRGRNLRLDFEIHEDLEDQDKVTDLMFDQIKYDLEDLLVNGDVEHTTDPLLKAMDGTKKRGAELSHLEFPRAELFRDHKYKKETIEYTLYLKVYTEFASPQ
jgi:hypothetical protein